MSNWQPIETAPKDTAIDLWADGTRWPDCWWVEGRGWQDGHSDYEYLDVEPTHWMPLPPPPASVDRSPEGGDRETGRHAKHESAVAANSSETPNLSAEGDS